MSGYATLENNFVKNFLSYMGKGIAVIILLGIIGSGAYFWYDYFTKHKPNPDKPTDPVDHKPKYTAGKVVSTVKQDDLKVNHEKLDTLIRDIDTIISEYSKQ